MARDEGFKISWDEFKKDLENYINTKTKDFAGNLTTDIAKAIVVGAQKRLVERATPRDNQSKMKVENLAKSIHIGKSDDGLSRTVIVPQGDEGLGMFLEYGTGLVGEKDPHPKAGEIGWSYAINKDNYRYAKARPDTMSKLGFIFKRSDTYLDGNDVNPLYRKSYKHIEPKVHRVYYKGYTDSLGRKREGYWKTVTRHEKDYEYHYFYRDWVLSQGLKPIRYIYDTRVNLNRIIGQYRRLPNGAQNLKKRLEKYIKNGK